MELGGNHMLEKLKGLFVCCLFAFQEKSQGSQEMSERVGERVLPSKMVLHVVDTDHSIHVNSNWRFQLVILKFPLPSLSLPRADRPLNPLKR